MNMIEYQTVCKIHNNELHTLTRLLQRHILMLAVDRTTFSLAAVLEGQPSLQT